MTARAWRGVLWVSLLALVLGSAVGAAGAPRVPNTVLVMGGVISDAVSLDPAQAFEFTSVWAAAQIYDTLVDFNREFNQVVPELATSWTVSADGRTYTFRLRRGVRFHSGNVVDAKAVEFSLQRAMKLNLTPAFILTSFIARPEDVVAVGADTVRVTFKQAMPEILMGSVLANPVSAVVDPALVQRNATPADPWANQWLSFNDAGSGPYKLRAWSKNVKIEFEAFEGYWRGTPRLRRVFYQEMPEPAAAMLALQRGDIDVASDLLPAQYKQLQGQPGIEVKTSPQFTVNYLAMNVGYEPFGKKEVRNAIKWAIDYDALRRIFEDALDPSQTIVPPGMFAHLAERPYRRDVARARALLREAGYERGFRAELIVPVTPPLPDVAAKIKEDLAAVGIEVEVRQLRSADLLGIYRAQRHQLVIQRWGADYPDPDNLARAFASFDARQLAWRNQWDHPVKRTVEQAVGELNRARREALYHEIQRIVLEEGPYAIYGSPLEQNAMRSNVKGLGASPLFAFTNLIDAWKE
ncbi:MAG: ABC transporter substrate-binding protein [Armatimonadota bacterium]|nr:ABC transporter substrate-binding protein [Armatimonadota bacterium]MDR7401016.1 ABC transporter substrate-binding protein [Armatimonadota bacterium]MDR7403224.1 ABC transporter substrate-binding protein [Armatimonadota bacterium]MDR7436727.1 ABC transporter substrate-binding protein [Armatimonadota bacterium]MDR7471201.1 ABC transporter substrate-binding protein [Armatimonadota bacterium]